MSAPMAREISLDLLEDFAREAGEIALTHFRNDPEIWTKGDDSPVCEADLEVDAYLKRALLGHYPDFGWISEESASAPDRVASGPIFVVDPIDGTRAFVRGDVEWAVSVGVIDKGRPVAGILFCPALDECFRTERGRGAERNGEPIAVSTASTAHGAKAAGPKSLLNDRVFFDLDLDTQPSSPSLAYRLAQVADGRLDFSLARRNAHDWDLVAADLLVQEAGGRLTDSEGRSIEYNKGTLAHPALICAPSGLHADLCDRVAAIMA